MPPLTRFVAYHRVSTQQQGRSGLGLDAQRSAVAGYVQGRGELVAALVEVESGRRTDRPELLRALELCRRQRAVLVIAKLDRLARNVAFIAGLMESGVEFVAVDMPSASRLTLHILAAVAEHEREMISQRTRAALAAAKARGTKLGGDRGYRIRPADRQRGLLLARERRARVLPEILDAITRIRAAGTTSASGIARELTKQHVPTIQGHGIWQATQVRRVLRAAG